MNARFFILTLATILVATLLFNTAQAVAQEATCSKIVHTGGGATNTYVVDTTTPSTTVCTIANNPLIDIPSGTGQTFSYHFTNTGAPLNIPASATVYWYIDNEQFGNPGGATPIRQVSVTIPSSGFQGLGTTYCTSDGTITGSPRYGIMRIVIRAQGTAGTFDVDSDDGGPSGATPTHGILRCTPKPTAYTDGNPTTSPTVYIGGDTLRTSITVNAAPYATPSGNLARIDIICGASTNPDSSIRPTTTAVTGDITIKGTTTTWPDDCTLQQQVVATTTTTIAGLTTKVIRWDQTSPISGVTFPNVDTAQRTAKTLDRTLTPSQTCTYTVDGSSVVGSFVHRSETLTTGACHWQNARNSVPPNNALGTAYVGRVSQAYTSTTDFPSTNALFDNMGNLATTHVASTTATATTGMQYTKSVEQYGASRTAGELYNFGRDDATVPSSFDVSATYTFVLDTSRAINPYVIIRTFTIGVDTAYTRVQDLENARGQPLSGLTPTCQRADPDGDIESAVSMGTTDGTGTTATHSYNVESPVGTWSYTCTVVSGGNTGTVMEPVTHTTPFTGDLQFGILANFTLQDNGTYLLNITTASRVYDVEADDMIPLTPDNLPRMTLQIYNATSGDYEARYARQLMLRTAPTVNVFYVNVYVNETDYDYPMLVLVFANVTARPITNSQYLNIMSDTVGDERMNPYLLGLAFMVAAFVIMYITKTSIMSVPLGVVMTIVGGYYSMTQVEFAPRQDAGYLFIVFIAFINIAYAVTLLMADRQNETADG